MKKAILYVSIALMLTACSNSKTYFTPSIRNYIEKGNQNLKKVQFYVDRDIVLRRELSTGETKVTSGKVMIENGRTINIVTIKKNTPGVCVLEKNNIVLTNPYVWTSLLSGGIVIGSIITGFALILYGETEKQKDSKAPNNSKI